MDILRRFLSLVHRFDEFSGSTVSGFYLGHTYAMQPTSDELMRASYILLSKNKREIEKNTLPSLYITFKENLVILTDGKQRVWNGYDIRRIVVCCVDARNQKLLAIFYHNEKSTFGNNNGSCKLECHLFLCRSKEKAKLAAYSIGELLAKEYKLPERRSMLNLKEENLNVSKVVDNELDYDNVAKFFHQKFIHGDQIDSIYSTPCDSLSTFVTTTGYDSGRASTIASRDSRQIACTNNKLLTDQPTCSKDFSHSTPIAHFHSSNSTAESKVKDYIRKYSFPVNNVKIYTSTDSLQSRCEDDSTNLPLTNSPSIKNNNITETETKKDLVNRERKFINQLTIPEIKLEGTEKVCRVRVRVACEKTFKEEQIKDVEIDLSKIETIHDSIVQLQQVSDSPVKSKNKETVEVVNETKESIAGVEKEIEKEEGRSSREKHVSKESSGISTKEEGRSSREKHVSKESSGISTKETCYDIYENKCQTEDNESSVRSRAARVARSESNTTANSKHHNRLSYKTRDGTVNNRFYRQTSLPEMKTKGLSKQKSVIAEANKVKQESILEESEVIPFKTFDFYHVNDEVMTSNGFQRLLELDETAI